MDGRGQYEAKLIDAQHADDEIQLEEEASEAVAVGAEPIAASDSVAEASPSNDD